MNRALVCCARVVSSIALVAMALSARVSAQVSTGVVAGTVVDQSGQPLRHASVELDDAEHGVTRTVESDDRGHFRATDMPPATYAITASAAGFRSVTRTVRVNVDSTTQVEFKL